MSTNTSDGPEYLRWDGMREHSTRVHADAVAEHLRACEDRGDGSVSLEALDAAFDVMREELRKADDLGFDHAAGAVRAVLACDDYAERWECPDALVRAVDAWKSLRLAARLAGVRS